MEATWVTVQEDPETGDLILPLPEGMCDKLGWDVGDTLSWNKTASGDGSFILSKTNPELTEWVLVDCILTYRMRYMVEVPSGKEAWALDTVTMEEAKEFSQKCLGETIVSYRAVSEAEALKICDNDNDYTSSWSDEQKKKTFFTSVKSVNNQDDNNKNET